jgi:hypothetical protein
LLVTSAQLNFAIGPGKETSSPAIKWDHSPAGAEGDLRRRFTVALSIFKFSPRFLAQIVENRRGRLSSFFFGPGDNFPKSYDENQIRSEQGPLKPGFLPDELRVFLSPRARTAALARGLKKTRSSSGINPGSSGPASDPTRALRAGLLRPDLVFVITFREIVPRT